MPTIKDVAKRAALSVATVSRVLNDSGYYHEETGRRVRQAVVALGYRRNIHWTRLARNSSETICFLLGNRESMNSMQMRLLMACERALHQAGYDLVFSRFSYSGDHTPGNLHLPRVIAQKGIVDGVILAGVHYGNLLEAFEGLKLPYMLLGNTFIGNSKHLEHDAVVYDDVSGAYEAVRYLIRLGHRGIAFVGNTQMPWFGRRYKGYSRALREDALRETAVCEPWHVSNIEYGQLAAAQLLRLSHPPTAIFGANDEIAAGAWKALVSRAVAIPRQISLMGFGDREELSILEPSLTTVSVFQEQLGTELAEMLLEKLTKPGRRVPSRTFPCKIVERSSCASPAAELRLVTKQ
jgi:DNA-binding LacI/PurR family transcriptional regulator